MMCNECFIMANTHSFFLGIDPGIADCGYAVVRASLGGNDMFLCTSGVWHTSPRMSFPERVIALQKEIKALLNEWSFSAAGIERLLFNRNVSSAIAVAEVRGMVVGAIGGVGVPVFECTPTEAKATITGYGKASKEQVAQMLRMLLKGQPVPLEDDASDAVAMAVLAVWKQSVPSKARE